MFRVAIALAVSLFALAASLQAQDAPVWRYTATEKISFYQLTPLGDLVVGTKEQIVALDPETGVPRWTRSDIRKLPAGGFNPIPFTPYGVVRTKEGIALIDLATGETLWDAKAVSMKKVRGYLTVPQHNLVLVYGETRESKRAFVAVHAGSGEVAWRQDTLVRKSPGLLKVDGIHSFAGHQPPLVDTDSTLVLYISKDGPMRIHSRTGQLLWRMDSNNDPPMLSEGHAPMLYDDGVLFVPYEKSSSRFSIGEDKLMALNVSDGSVIWDRKFPIRVIQMELTPHGLVVRGQRRPPAPVGGPPEYRAQVQQQEQLRERELNPTGLVRSIDLVDRETGISSWNVRTDGMSPFILDGDAIFLALGGVVQIRDSSGKIHARDGALVALDFTGTELMFPVDFEGGEYPNAVEKSGTNFLLSSNQNFVSMNRAGAVKYHRYYEPPGRSLLEQAAMLASAAALIAMDRDCAMGGDPKAFTCGWGYEDPDSVFGLRFRNAETWANFAYVFTKQPDSSGREGFSLVKLDKRDGQEVGRVWIDERRPDYVLDPASGFLFVKENNKEIYALKFPSD